MWQSRTCQIQNGNGQVEKKKIEKQRHEKLLTSKWIILILLPEKGFPAT